MFKRVGVWDLRDATPPPLHRDKAICVKWRREEDGPQSNEVLMAAGSKWRLTEARRMQPQR